MPLTVHRRARPGSEAVLVAARTLLAVVASGMVAGLGGDLLIAVLHLVQHTAYGYTSGSFADAVERTGRARRVLVLTTGGAVVGLAWEALRRWLPATGSVADAVADPGEHPDQGVAARLRVLPTALDAVVQVVAVGVGASLGREGAPRQVGAALAGALARRLRLGTARQRTLVACGAGAGLAAVYDVPLSGTLFTLEVLLRSAAPVDAVPALATAAIATAVAWPVTGGTPVYPVPPFSPPTPGLLLAALVLGPVAGAVGLGFTRLCARARAVRPRGWRLLVAVPVVFAALGAAAALLPELLGNGRGPAQLAFTGSAGLGLAAALLVAKPLATAACLRAGAVGGLLTPALATGAVLGTLAGRLGDLVWPGQPLGALAVVTAAAVLAVTQRAPLLAVALVLELTGAALVLVVPIAVAVTGATGLARCVARRGPQR